MVLIELNAGVSILAESAVINSDPKLLGKFCQSAVVKRYHVNKWNYFFHFNVYELILNVLDYIKNNVCLGMIDINVYYTHYT